MKVKIKYLIILILILIFVGGIFLFAIKEVNNKKKIEQEKELVATISKHYNNFVITNKETKLYKLINNSYEEYGLINDNIKIKLNDTKISKESKYFLVDGLDLYIYYADVEPIDEFIKNDRYNYYIYFNKNIITNDTTSFYDENDNYKYKINESFDFKVLINDEDKYGIVYNDELLYVNKEDVKEEYDNQNTDLKNKSRIKTLGYHFIYDPETETCTNIICQSLDQLESHLKYIKENDYLTLTMEELELYLDGKLQIPEKSIVLTVDDGTFFNPKGLDLLEKYGAYATLFAVTAWCNPDDLRSPNLAIESHTDYMHNQYECKGYGSQGGGILCLPEEQVFADLKLSQEKLDGSNYFAYPFYDFNDRAIELLKKAGFHMAFIGSYDTDGYSYPNVTDKYKVRRTTILSSTTMEEFISYLN